MGEFLVIDVTHDVGDDRFYGNSFRAIPSVARSLPVRDVGRSVAETQVARVIGNADPDGKGRVQVQMNWQTGNMRTGWIRVMSPDDGGSENVPTNRGFVFIPEVGDHVLVGFRHGDPNRPYVMGSLFNGTTGAGGLAENHLKSIRTRSGHALELDDSPSSLGIPIKDNKGNYIYIDSNGDNIILNAEKIITISAGETMTLNCKNMRIQVNENKKEDIGQSKRITIAKDYILDASNKKEHISEDSTLCVGESLEQTVGDLKTSVIEGDLIFSAQGRALVQGKTDARISRE